MNKLFISRKLLFQVQFKSKKIDLFPNFKFWFQIQIIIIFLTFNIFLNIWYI